MLSFKKSSQHPDLQKVSQLWLLQLLKMGVLWKEKACHYQQLLIFLFFLRSSLIAWACCIKMMGPTHKETQLGYVHPLSKDWRVMVLTWKGWILPSKFLRRIMVLGIQTPSLDVQMGCNLNSQQMTLAGSSRRCNLVHGHQTYQSVYS